MVNVARSGDPRGSTSAGTEGRKDSSRSIPGPPLPLDPEDFRSGRRSAAPEAGRLFVPVPLPVRHPRLDEFRPEVGEVLEELVHVLVVVVPQAGHLPGREPGPDDEGLPLPGGGPSEGDPGEFLDPEALVEEALGR